MTETNMDRLLLFVFNSPQFTTSLWFFMSSEAWFLWHQTRAADQPGTQLNSVCSEQTKSPWKQQVFIPEGNLLTLLRFLKPVIL